MLKHFLRLNENSDYTSSSSFSRGIIIINRKQTEGASRNCSLCENLYIYLIIYQFRNDLIKVFITCKKRHFTFQCSDYFDLIYLLKRYSFCSLNKKFQFLLSWLNALNLFPFVDAWTFSYFRILNDIWTSKASSFVFNVFLLLSFVLKIQNSTFTWIICKSFSIQVRVYSLNSSSLWNKQTLLTCYNVAQPESVMCD